MSRGAVLPRLFLGCLHGMRRASLVGMQTHYWGPAGEGAVEGLWPGDVLASNHPQLAGGSHLPDITVITPVFNKGRIEYASCDLAITSDCCKEAPAPRLLGGVL